MAGDELDLSKLSDDELIELYRRVNQSQPTQPIESMDLSKLSDDELHALYKNASNTSDGVFTKDDAVARGLAAVGLVDTEEAGKAAISDSIRPLLKSANALAGAVYEGVSTLGEDVSPQSRSGLIPFDELNNPRTKDFSTAVGEGIYKGWTQEKNYTGTEFLKRHGVLENSPNLRAAAGLYLDIFGIPDPLGMKSTRAVLGTGYKYLAKGTEKALVGAKLADGVNTLFNTRLGKSEAVKASLDILENVPRVERAQTAAMVRMLRKHENALDAHASRLGVTTAQERQKVYELMEHKGNAALAPGATGVEYLVANDLKAANALAYMADQASGNVYKALSSSKIDYALHMVTRDAMEVLGMKGNPEHVSTAVTSTIRQLEKDILHKSRIRREFQDIPAAEINQWAWDTGKLPPGIKFFHDDAIYTTYVRLSRTIRGSTAAQALKSIGDKVGVKVDLKKLGSLEDALALEKKNAEALAGEAMKFKQAGPAFMHDYVTAAQASALAREKLVAPAAQDVMAHLAHVPADYRIYRSGPLAGKAIPADVADAVMEWHTLRLPRNVGTVIGTYDKLQSWWKAWGLGINPAYFTRNVIQNIVLNAQAGVNNIRDYVTAGLLQMGFRDPRAVLTTNGWGRKPVLVSGKPVTYDTVMHEFEQRAGSIGASASELEAVGMSRAPGTEPGVIGQVAQWLPFTSPKDNKILRATFGTGVALENNARLAHFIAKLREGKSFEEAALSVKKYLYDYSDETLSAVERNVLKRVAPFYGYFRRNLPAQIEVLLKNPAQHTKWLRVKDNIEYDRDNVLDDSWLSPWMDNQFPIKLGRRADNPNVQAAILIGSYLPIGDLDKIWGRNKAAKQIISMLSPIIKEGTGQLLDMDIDKSLDSVLDGGEAIPIKGFGNKREFLGTSWDPRLVHLMRTMVALNAFDRWNPGDIMSYRPDDPDARPRSRQDAPAFDRALQAIAGARVYDVNLEQRAISKQYSARRQLQKIEREMRRLQQPKPGFPQGDVLGQQEIMPDLLEAMKQQEVVAQDIAKNLRPTDLRAMSDEQLERLAKSLR